MIDFSDKTVLIVDDEKNTRDGLRRSFEGDFDVYLAENAEAALETLRSESIDVMVTDLRLGGDDGMELIEEALKLPRAPICILMTAYGSVDVAVEELAESDRSDPIQVLQAQQQELKAGAHHRLVAEARIPRYCANVDPEDRPHLFLEPVERVGGRRTDIEEAR